MSDYKDGMNIWNFCSAGCSCQQDCKRRFNGLCRRMQVFFVNPIKKWGLRTLEDIKHEEILFEYAGEISLEADDHSPDNDYIFSFYYVWKF
jgi:SET domain-containing protein